MGALPLTTGDDVAKKKKRAAKAASKVATTTAKKKARKSARKSAKESAKKAAKTATAARRAPAAATGPLSYLAISASILPNDPQAPAAREALIQRVDLEPHQWATADTVVVQVQSISQMSALLDDLEALNDTFDTCFEGIAFLVPHQQLWWLSDRPSNLSAIVAITGRQPR